MKIQKLSQINSNGQKVIQELRNLNESLTKEAAELKSKLSEFNEINTSHKLLSQQNQELKD